MTHTITVDAGKNTLVVIIKTTFRLYRNDPQSFKTLAELSGKIFRETKLEVNLLLRGDKILHLTVSRRRKLTKETLLQKTEVAVGIIKEVYGVPQARVQIQQGLF
ncbi:MAG: hypothetical protein G01um101429_27 [Parcubacteria group bacterium Gr01-1014_29]|nr:MAG: hypothetical protein G01um101429_27 [Parcubacteria group bacterium Gr01-1014_29]